MSKHITTLSALFLLQLIIAGLLFSTNSGMQSNINPQSLVHMDKNELNQIQIIAKDTELILTKHEGDWRLKEYPELPLLASKITSLTSELTDTQVTWPVTRTASSHERFKVAEDNFEKRIVFTDKNNNKHELLLGESPSYKQLYVRDADGDEVFSIEYSAYQLSTKASDWLDKSLLSINGISKVSHSSVNLEKHDNEWQLTSPTKLNDQQSLNTESITDLVNQLTSLTVSGIAEETYEATNKLIIHDDKNTEYIYSFAANNDNYFVKRNDINQWFTIPKLKFETLANVSVDKFISETSEQEEDEANNISE